LLAYAAFFIILVGLWYTITLDATSNFSNISSKVETENVRAPPGRVPLQPARLSPFWVVRGHCSRRGRADRGYRAFRERQRPRENSGHRPGYLLRCSQSTI